MKILHLFRFGIPQNYKIIQPYEEYVRKYCVFSKRLQFWDCNALTFVRNLFPPTVGNLNTFRIHLDDEKSILMTRIDLQDVKMEAVGKNERRASEQIWWTKEIVKIKSKRKNGKYLK